MFKENSKAIYLQIADRICDSIMEGTLRPEDRLPSVREYASTVQVNPNTMMRTYEHLSTLRVIYNKRGIGFFVSPEAVEIVTGLRRERFLDNEIYDMFRQLQLLGISAETLKRKYDEYLQKNS